MAEVSAAARSNARVNALQQNLATPLYSEVADMTAGGLVPGYKPETLTPKTSTDWLRPADHRGRILRDQPTWAWGAEGCQHCRMRNLALGEACQR
jgi:hypothetical protein